ncbi:peroxynitrite isomerase THAP4-like [Polyodon spathula]|uniref:peroxynitrite isomerase THAP4-like n=1 Tax=Polyodon spathula TaxID=7913 RepID=UPI001B7E6043|nr:peroxynitrite isomerase THAP4-like [Polyodon spathula]
MTHRCRAPLFKQSGCWGPGSVTSQERGPSPPSSPSDTLRCFTSSTWDSPCLTSCLVEIEEGKLSGQELTLQSQSVSRISFAKQPHVQQISRTFRLKEDGRLEQMVCMATESQPLSEHLHITYRKTAP